MKALGLFILTATLSACATPRIQLDAKWDAKAKPSYEDYLDYYWFGFSGRNTLSLQKICVDQKPYGAQATRTLEDTLLTLVTLGIYTPMTVDVWCGD